MKYLILAQVIIGLYFIIRWWWIKVVPEIMKIRLKPDGLHLMTMNHTEGEFIVWCSKNLTGNILWCADVPVDPLVNYYIFPHRIYYNIPRYNDVAKAKYNIRVLVNRFEHGNIELEVIK